MVSVDVTLVAIQVRLEVFNCPNNTKPFHVCYSIILFMGLETTAWICHVPSS